MNTNLPIIRVKHLHSFGCVSQIFLLAEWHKVEDGCCLLQGSDEAEVLMIQIGKPAKLVNRSPGTSPCFSISVYLVPVNLLRLWLFTCTRVHSVIGVYGNVSSFLMHEKMR